MFPDQTIAHYRITAKLGEGGMGAVYRATDTKLGRDVAIKVLPESFQKDPDRLARFTREAQVLASLNHPNVAAIYGVEEGAIILELVEGEDLRGPLPMDTAVEYARQIASGLEAAHERGVVHRDLKPANIKVTPDGVVKLLDFGLAKSQPEASANTASPTLSPTLSLAMTQAGMILGTAAYMAPEQARGKPVDKRADIWAFGVVLFEMLTGKQIFTAGDTVTDIIAAIVTREPDWRLLPAATPPGVRRLLERCLRKDPKLRLRDIGEARILLEEPAVPDVAAEVPAVVPPARRGVPWWAWAAGAVVVASAAFWAGSRFSGAVPVPVMRLNVDLGPESAGDSVRFGAAISPDGKRLVFQASASDGRVELATRLLDQNKVMRLAGTNGAVGPFFSPDGQWLGFFADGKLMKVSVQGGAPIQVCDAANARGGAWGADGTIVFTPNTTSGLWQVRETGGVPEQLTNLSVTKQRTHRFPQFLPGGRAVLFTAHIAVAGFDDAEIDVLDLKTGQWKAVMRGGFYGRYVPSGHLVYIHQGTLFAVRFDVARLETIGTPVPVLDDMAASLVSGTGDYAFSSAPTGPGLLVYRAGKARDQNTPIVWLDGNGNTLPVLPTPKRYQQPRLSPDGKLLAVATGGLTASDIFVWDAQRGSLSQLTFNAQSNLDPVWSPDGKHLVFASNTNGIHTMWWLRADGAGRPRKLIEGADPIHPNAISPDGLLAYHQMTAGTGADLWTLPLDLSDPENPKAGKPELFLQTPKAEAHPAFSPDGRWLMYAADDTGSFQIYVRPFPGGSRGAGGKWVISAGNGILPRWSAGRQIFYQTLGGGLMVLDYEAKGDNFTAGKPRPWAATRSLLTGLGWNYDVAPDGKRVAAMVSEESTPAQKTNLHVVFLLNFFDDLRSRVP